MMNGASKASDGLKIADGLELPVSLVILTQAILAKKGSGKTYTAAVIAEEMLTSGLPVTIIDPTGAWWGIKSSADGESAGYPVVVFGGDHADVDITPDSGEVVALSLVEGRYSAVIDLSLFRKGEMQRFTSPFLETLYRKNREAMHLIVDEADTVAPQKPFGDEARTLGAMQDVVRRGRIRGIGVTLITQRPQVLNKDVLTQADVLWALRLSHPKDLAAIKEWVDVHADARTAKEMLTSLPSLPIGTAWVWAPAFNILQRAAIRRKQTYDSSRTPQPGESLKAPRVLASVDIEKIGREIEATVADVRTNSVESLKTEIARLKALLESKTSAKVAPDAIQRAVEAEREKMRQEYQQLAVKMAQSASDAQRNLREVTEAISHLIHDGVLAPATPQTVASVSAGAPMRSSVATSLTPKRPRLNNVRTTNGARALSGTSLKVAQIAAGYGASGKGIKRSILAAMCGVVDGGSFSARLSEAKSAGAVMVDDGVVHATPDGVAAYAGQFMVPASTDDVLGIWLPKLGGVSRKVLEHLVSLRGAPVSRPDLAAAVGVVDGGSFSARVSEVRRTGLLSDAGRGHIAANVEALFLS